MTKVAVVVPTNRPERFEQFWRDWRDLLVKHGATLHVVLDGDDPAVHTTGRSLLYGHPLVARPALRRSDLPADQQALVCDHADSVRNLGFLAAVRRPYQPDVIVTLDDDVAPWGGNDPIQEHLDALAKKVPVSWFSTASEYMRGFPYGVRGEADVWVSHGVWEGVRDYDAPTQLVRGNPPAGFYQGPIPKGCLTPVCGMNLAWRVEAAPYVYFAPMGEKHGVHRFGDIWMGVYLKRALDSRGKAVVTGYSTVHHTRASNVFANLRQEAEGIAWNEHWWEGEIGLGALDDEARAYFAMYQEKRERWDRLMVEVCAL